MCTFYVCVIYGGTGNLCDVKAPDTVLRRGLRVWGFWVQILLAPVSSVVRQAVSSSATEKQQEPPACGENSVRLEIPSAKCHAW